MLHLWQQCLSSEPSYFAITARMWPLSSDFGVLLLIQLFQKLLQQENFKLYISLSTYLGGTHSILHGPFFQAEEILGMRGLDIWVYHKTTEAQNTKISILRRLIKIMEVMVDKCPTQALSKQLLDSFKTVMFSRHTSSFNIHQPELRRSRWILLSMACLYFTAGIWLQ